MSKENLDFIDSLLFFKVFKHPYRKCIEMKYTQKIYLLK